MSRADPLVHIRLDNKKEAQRRAKEDFRGNMTAYINELVKQDSRRHPSKKKTK